MDEVSRRSISKALDEKIRILKQESDDQKIPLISLVDKSEFQRD